MTLRIVVDLDLLGKRPAAKDVDRLYIRSGTLVQEVSGPCETSWAIFRWPQPMPRWVPPKEAGLAPGPLVSWLTAYCEGEPFQIHQGMLYTVPKERSESMPKERSVRDRVYSNHKAILPL